MTVATSCSIICDPRPPTNARRVLTAMPDRGQISRNVSSPETRRGIAIYGGVALLLVCVYGLTAPGYIDVSDGQTMFAVTESIVEDQDSSISPELGGRPGVLGEYYSKYGIVWSALAVPFYMLGSALDTAVPALAGRMTIFLVSMVNVLVTVLTCLVLLRFCRALGFSSDTAALVTLAYGLGTMAWHYALKPFSEPLVALGLLSCSYLLYRNRQEPSHWRPLIAGACMALAIMAKTSALIFVPPMMLYALPDPQGSWRPRIRLGVVPFLLAVSLGIVAVGAYNYLRFGNWLETGYGLEGAGSGFVRSWDSFFYALYGFLLSPGKSVFLYNPVLLAGFVLLPWFSRHYPREGFLILACSVLVLVFHSNLVISWYGGWSWGPRFLLPVFPLALLPIAAVQRAAPGTDTRPIRLSHLILAILAISIAVQILAIAVSPRRFYHANSNVQDLEVKSVEDVGYSPLLNQVFYVGQAFRNIRDGRVGGMVHEAGRDIDNPVGSDLFLNVFHFWWLLAYYMGLPKLPITLAVSSAIVIAAIAGAYLLVTLRQGWDRQKAIDCGPHLEGTA